ncbi:MAG: ribonuclease P protein component [Patescibacteria group bacterium]|nr:ribonuclease P protein component [Patescibacteria group bacterium]
MLKKEFRLRKQKDFENVFNKGFYFSGDFLLLKTAKNGLPISRFGFIVSKKISKKAVERNRVKRLLRESVRLMQENVRAGFDAVFISKTGIVGKEFKEINLAAGELLKKSKLIL